MERAVKIGKVRWKNAAQSSAIKIGVGLEKLDRNLYDPRRCYDDLEQLGAKWVRIQSGWCRTEKEKGCYDFSWLDEIVDSLIARGMTPWMCLCYGNELYTPGANNAAGAVGRPPIHTEEERQGWDQYVTACVAHYQGRVDYFEIWNEPDGNWCWRPQAKAEEYRDFSLRTAKAIRRGNKDAKVLVNFCTGLDYLYRFLDFELAQEVDFVTYHRYSFAVEAGTQEYVAAIRDYAQALNPAIRVIQGETGAPSRNSTQGALKNADWTERKQAKYLLRKTVADLMADVDFTSYFSTVDIFENISNDYVNITEAYYGFFGLLGETFDGEGKPQGKYYRKDSFRAMQTLCSIFGEDVKKAPVPALFLPAHSMLIGGTEETPETASAPLYASGFIRENGASAFVYWKGCNVMTEEYQATVSLRFFGRQGNIRLIDLYTGDVYELNEEMIAREGKELVLNHLPIRDYPLMVTFGEFAEIE